MLSDNAYFPYCKKKQKKENLQKKYVSAQNETSHELEKPT